jgi:pyruvate kinase
MIENPTPTRAEVTDIANAIYEGADAIMLSGETSIGKYPLECVQFLKSIALKTEKFKTLGYEKNLMSDSDWQHLGVAANQLAQSVQADGIIVVTRTGYTANIVSNAKPFKMPIFCFTNNMSTLSHLSLVGSTHAYFIKSISNHNKTIKMISKSLKSYFNSKEPLKLVMISGIFSEEHSEAIQVINI